MRMTATPARASSPISSWTSALAPTSMPRVGSSRISTDGFDVEPLGEHHLLLVATREVADRRRAATACGCQAGPGSFAAVSSLRVAVDQTPAGHEAAQPGQRDVRGDRLRQRQPETAAILRDVGDAVIHRVARALDLDDLAARAGSCPRRRASTPNSASGDLGAPRADEPGEAEHLALAAPRR